MFHKVRSVAAIPDFKLSVQFSEGVTKVYDVKPLFEKLPVFRRLESDPAEFGCVAVDVGGVGIVWNDELDLSCDELWENGTVVKTSFDGLMAFSDATELWGLNESTLRKAGKRRGRLQVWQAMGGFDRRNETGVRSGRPLRSGNDGSIDLRMDAFSMPKGGIFQRSTIEKDGKGLPYGDRYQKSAEAGRTGFGGFFMGFTPSGRAWR